MRGKENQKMSAGFMYTQCSHRRTLLYSQAQRIFCITKIKNKVTSKVNVAQSCRTLCEPMDCSLPGSSVHGIFQARILSGLPLPSPESNYRGKKLRGFSYPKAFVSFYNIAQRPHQWQASLNSCDGTTQRSRFLVLRS